MNLLLYLLEYRERTALDTRRAATLHWRISLAAKAVMAHVIKELPVGEFSAQLNTLRDSIEVK